MVDARCLRIEGLSSELHLQVQVRTSSVEEACQPVAGRSGVEFGARFSYNCSVAMAARILIGTSGYSYDDWIGPVYPLGTSKKDFLSLYSSEFPIVELNFSYYRQPSASMLERMIVGTPGGFSFALKAHRSMTHEIGDTWAEDIATFREGVKPLQEAGRLSAILLQFPYSFSYTPESRKARIALRRLGRATLSCRVPQERLAK